MTDVTRLLHEIKQGDTQASEDLLPPSAFDAIDLRNRYVRRPW